MRENPRWKEIWGACVQDHEHIQKFEEYSTTVSNVTPFNVPKIGEYVEVKLDRVISVLAGSVLWNPNIGSLLIKTFDSDSNIITITSDNVLVDFGKAVLANTLFIIGIPQANLPTEDDYLNSPYLLADFVCPKEGHCQIASVTTTAGITLNQLVSIRGHRYRVGDVLTKDTIRLCNDGEGASEGTVIVWDEKNCGKPNIPLILYSTNPCEAEPVATGNIVVCNNDLGLTTITGEADGQLLQWNNIQKRWELVTAYLDENCTYLTTCLTIDTIEDEEHTYVANVDSNGLFNVDNKIIIEDKIFIIDSKEGDTILRIHPETPFTEVTTYAVGTTVCLQSCCSWVPEKLDDTVDSESWRPIGLQNYMINYAKSVVNSSTSDLAKDTERSTSNITVTISNTDKTHPLTLLVMLETIVTCVIAQSSSSIHRAIHQTNKIVYNGHTLSGSSVVPDVKTYEEKHFDTRDFPTLSQDAPITIVHVQVRAVRIPPYDEDHPETSTCSIVGSHTLRNLNQSNGPLKFNVEQRHQFETRLYIQGNYNELTTNY